MTDPKQPVHLENRTQEAARQFSPSAARNREPIAEAFLPHVSRGAYVLEIASGTGEHALHMCQTRPDILWQPSDVDAAALQSQSAWREERAAQISPPLALDVTQPDWWVDLSGVSAMFCANMIHIAPWAAALGLAKGAEHVLPEGGIFGLYGPFLDEGNSAPSNLTFDQNLKARNPDWGVRELKRVKHIFVDAGFNMSAAIDLPRENRLILFKKQG